MSGFKILMENATTFADRRKMDTLLESERANVDAAMVTNLYRSAIEKAHINFDSIPDSKGDITKYEGFTQMKKSLEIVDSLSKQSSVKVSEVEVVQQTLSILASNAPKFVKGFLLDDEMTKLLYCTMVYACVESTSLIISSYVDFVKNPNSLDFTLVKNTKLGGGNAIQNLRLFNSAYAKGDLSKILNEFTTKKSNAVGTIGGAMAVGLITTTALLSIVPILRELVFGFYYTRMQLSDYLDQQVALIELHRRNVELSQLPSNERKEVIKKQEKRAKQLLQLSDKIRINTTKGGSEAVHEIKKENKSWTIDSVQTQVASSDAGFSLL